MLLSLDDVTQVAPSTGETMIPVKPDRCPVNVPILFSSSRSQMLQQRQIQFKGPLNCRVGQFGFVCFWCSIHTY